MACWNEDGFGVQLNQDSATEFIISLPPVTFEKGFTLYLTDTNGATTKIKSDKLNTVLRSSILVMPEINVDEYEWVQPQTPIQLNNVLSAVSNVQNGTNSVTLNLATDGISYYIDPNTWNYVYEGTGNFLALDLYSADGYLHEGIYYPSSTGGTINEGEFGIGWDPGDLWNIGMVFENWGTCWWNVGDGAATINRKITDGYVIVSRNGDNWVIELTCGENESMLWTKFEGAIEALTDPNEAAPAAEYTFTDELGDAVDMTTYQPIAGLKTHTLRLFKGEEPAVVFYIIAKEGEDIAGTYKCQENAAEAGLMFNGWDASFMNWGDQGSYYYENGKVVYINAGETLTIAKLGEGLYSFDCSTGHSYVAQMGGAEETPEQPEETPTKPETPAGPEYTEFAQLLNIQVNQEYDQTTQQPTGVYYSVTVQLATAGITTETTTNAWGWPETKIGGNGQVLSIDFYTADGTLAAGTYQPCATPGTVLEGEFGVGFDFVMGDYSDVWGTTVTPYTNDVPGDKAKVTDGTIKVEKSGDTYTITLESTTINAKYVGTLTL